MASENDYIEVIKEQITDLINDYDLKNVEKYENDFETLKNIIETFSGRIAVIYPYLNNIFQFIYDNYKNNPEYLNCKFLSITGSYTGEIFEYWKDYKSAIHAYSYSYFVDGELQNVTKLLTIQILQIILNNPQLAAEIHLIIQGLLDEFNNMKSDRNFYLNGKKVSQETAMEIIKLYINLSKFIIERGNPNLNDKDKKFFTNRIKFTQKELLLKGVKLYFVMKNLERLYEVFK
ncbi:MAG: hypothetical protein ACTSPY_17940 [Candidatus Helarchaeota archaeon]